MATSGEVSIEMEQIRYLLCFHNKCSIGWANIFSWRHLLFPFYIFHEVFYVVLCICWGHCSLFYSSFPHPDEKHFTNEAFQQRIKVSPPEKNLVDPERALSRCNAHSLLLRGQDWIQADVNVLFLPAELRRLKTLIHFLARLTKSISENCYNFFHFPPFDRFKKNAPFVGVVFPNSWCYC